MAALLTPQEIAPILNFPRNRVYELIADGVIPHIRIGRSIRIPRDAFEAWLVKQGQQALADVREVGNVEA